MKVLNRLVRFLDNITDLGLVIVFLFFIFLGLYSVYDSYMFYQGVSDDTILKYKPGYEGGGDPEKSIKGNMVAWLTIFDTEVDYPVMQGDDNFEYLNKDPFGDYSLAGSIFLDSRNRGDFTDYYSLIYGHHMEQNMMFGVLAKYLDEDYFKEHQKAQLIVGDKTYDLDIFAVLEADAMQDAVFAPTECDDMTLEYIKANAVYMEQENIPKADERIVGLSTCKFPSTLLRTLVFGTLREPEDATAVKETM